MLNPEKHCNGCTNFGVRMSLNDENCR